MRYAVAPALALLLSLAPFGASQAGPYADDLGKCLVQATTIADKGMLVRWVFAMAALHPEVRQASSLTGEQRAELSEGMANLFTALMTDRCKDRAIDAVKYEGPSTLSTGFAVLGQAAMMELFSNPEVARGLAELDQYVDKGKIEATFGQPKPDEGAAQ